MEPEGYEPLSGRAKWARRALVTLIALDAISVVSGYFEYSLYGQDVITQDEVDANDIRQGLVALLDFTAFVVVVVMFIRWFKRAYANLPALGVPKLRYRRGWAIWGWFFPFLNLYRPKQLANDIWRGSDPAAPIERDADWDRRPVPALFQWWWGVYLCWGFLYNVAFRISATGGADASSLQDDTAAYMVADSVSVLGAILALLVVRAATTRQEERAARLASAPTVPETA
jgi:hypothetical protein